MGGVPVRTVARHPALSFFVPLLLASAGQRASVTPDKEAPALVAKTSLIAARGLMVRAQGGLSCSLILPYGWLQPVLQCGSWEQQSARKERR